MGFLKKAKARLHWLRDEVFGNANDRQKRENQERENRKSQNDGEPSPHPDLYTPGALVWFLTKLLTFPIKIAFRTVSEFYYQMLYTYKDDKSLLRGLSAGFFEGRPPLAREVVDQAGWGLLGSILGKSAAWIWHLLKKPFGKADPEIVVRLELASKLLEIEELQLYEPAYAYSPVHAYSPIYTPETRDYIFHADTDGVKLNQFLAKSMGYQRNNVPAVLEIIQRRKWFSNEGNPLVQVGVTDVVSVLNCRELYFLDQYLNRRIDDPSMEELINIVEIIRFIEPDTEDYKETLFGYLENQALSLKTIHFITNNIYRNIYENKNRDVRKTYFKFVFELNQRYPNINPALIFDFIKEGKPAIQDECDNGELFIANSQMDAPINFYNAEQLLDAGPILEAIMKQVLKKRENNDINPIRSSDYPVILEWVILLSENQKTTVLDLLEKGVPHELIKKYHDGNMSLHDFDTFYHAVPSRSELTADLTNLYDTAKARGWLAEVPSAQRKTMLGLLELGVSPKEIARLSNIEEIKRWSEDKISKEFAKLTRKAQLILVKHLKNQRTDTKEDQVFVLYLIAKLDGRTEEVEPVDPEPQPGYERGELEHLEEKEAEDVRGSEHLALAQEIALEQVAIQKSLIDDRTGVIEQKRAQLVTNGYEIREISKVLAELNMEESARVVTARPQVGELDGELTGEQGDERAGELPKRNAHADKPKAQLANEIDSAMRRLLELRLANTNLNREIETAQSDIQNFLATIARIRSLLERIISAKDPGQEIPATPESHQSAMQDAKQLASQFTARRRLGFWTQPVSAADDREVKNYSPPMQQHMPSAPSAREVRVGVRETPLAAASVLAGNADKRERVVVAESVPAVAVNAGDIALFAVPSHAVCIGSDNAVQPVPAGVMRAM